MERNMLVMTRKENEAILIGKNIRIIVVKIRGKQVRLGIEAPPDLLILREEEIPLDRGMKN
jgi:carbon storage regulator